MVRDILEQRINNPKSFLPSAVVPDRDMKLSVAFFLLLSLLLFADLSHGRRGQGEYWKKIMKDEAIPEVLKELLYEEASASSSTKNDRFINNFDPHPNAIIYHSHGHGAATHNHNHPDQNQKIKLSAGGAAP